MKTNTKWEVSSSPVESGELGMQTAIRVDKLVRR
jgi:hypothetical protein